MEQPLDDQQLRRLSGIIAWRLTLAAAVLGTVGGAFLYFRLGFGMIPMTLALLMVPLIVVLVLAWVLRIPANRVPRPMTWLGGVGTVVGVAWLIISPGHIPAILVFALGVWLFVVGLIASVAVGTVGSRKRRPSAEDSSEPSA
ncbi:hypothetical protein CATRI_11605 [Corynebacterium atrinae]|uniref:hypothetical protein n=1 Tax=Corynebacterium atrinae TaxID=1336740 RepID=UPI0025B40709|nr:hypothetical protein [Corynebacterium atrinae]WJY64370.1 hypothetical protein CATRI_11605 [Corynebacterium atrinae]